MSSTLRPSIISGTLNINVLLSFAFGVIFISVMLAFATVFPNPTPFAQWVFIVVVALAGAGIGAVVPGILHIEAPYVRAGGALAVFLAIFLMKPGILDATATLVTPPISPQSEIDNYLRMVDSKQVDAAWQTLDEAAKETLAKDRGSYRQSYAAGREPLGPVTKRTQVGTQDMSSPNGVPIGIYRTITFKTEFGVSGCRPEAVTVRATTEKEWKVFSHQIGMAPVPCSP